MPPPSPAPVPAPPSPPQTVLVNLPPELLHKLSAPDDHWWAQPAATVGAAVIALIAAGIAVFGVRMQINRAHKSDCRAAMAEAYASAWELVRVQALVQLEHNREVATEYAKAYMGTLTATGRLIALSDLDHVVAAMKTLMEGATKASNPTKMPSESVNLPELMDKVEEAIKAAKV